MRELLKTTQLLSTEKDIDQLLELILSKSRSLTGADAGSIYVVKEDEAGTKKLHFMLSQNDSIKLPVKKFSIEISHSSISGSVALSKEPLAIDDVYAMPKDLGFSHSKEMDQKIGYETHSMLTAPMLTNRDVIGVIQLINKKKDPDRTLTNVDNYLEMVHPFTENDRELLLSLASQAAIALENAQLYNDIKTMFDGIVNASVHAIEQRDPTTSGHSRRVSLLTTELAKLVDRVDEGRFARIKFTNDDLDELRIAALLHDFGKIGVEETVLLKATKLQPTNFTLVLERLERIRYYKKSQFLSKQLYALQSGGSQKSLSELEEEWTELEERILEFKRIISKANQPTILPEGEFAIIDEISKFELFDEDGKRLVILSPSDVECLKIRKGTLTLQELEEIQSHAMKTYEFLQLIPWGGRFRDLPYIAGTHHEKLDGSGYPFGLKEHEIPVQSKLMAISDIFDALTASDRPYKKAVPIDKALNILNFEVKDHHLDEDLVSLFIKHNIYQKVF